MSETPDAPDPTLPGWARGAIAFVRELARLAWGGACVVGALLRHPLTGAPGLGTVTVGTLLIGVSVLWFVWAVVFGGGQAVRDAIPAIVGGLSAWQGMRARRPYADQYGGGGYAAPYSGAFDGYEGGVPGDPTWPTH
jgi:hypothetical protein